MSNPISPPAARGARGTDLPAYLSNGVIGLRVRENPLQTGMATLAGFVGEHPERGIEALALAPYPLGGDLAVDGVWIGDAPEGVDLIDQAHDFATGELTTRIGFAVGGARIEIEALTFCSRSQPTIVCQELTVRAERTCDLAWRVFPDMRGVSGRLARRRVDTPGEAEPVCDGALLWCSTGDLSKCGYAYVTTAPESAERSISERDTGLLTEYRLRLAAGRSVRLRQMASLVQSSLHDQPDFQAVRLIARAADIGFDAIRRENRECWEDLWKGRIRLVGADPHWQALADAGFYYLNASVHASSPASTSIFGLATWHDYHYYFGHVMWDIDAFGIGALSVMQPEAARSMLDFRSRGLTGARDNAKLLGRLGLQFPWEAGALTGQEATPGGASAAWREDHVNLHVARAFAQFADLTGNQRFLREQAWPVLAGVADWVVDRVSAHRGGYDFKRLGGPAEQSRPVDNDALTIMASRVVLRRAAEAARTMGQDPPAAWLRVAEGLSPPLRSDGAIAMHEDHRKDEEKGSTPAPLMGLFPYWDDVEPATADKTLRFYLDLWEDYVGSPMLAALYGTWAAWAGDRDLSLKLLDEGYGRYMSGRFLQTLEYRLDKMPGGAAAGPFFANIAGFLTGLLFGMPGLRPDAGPPEAWPCRPVVLPAGWQAIEVDRLWVRGQRARLVARHGAERAELVLY
jgi:trehalose/maltose hydrolase-like predicted phosphorylase